MANFDATGYNDPITGVRLPGVFIKQIKYTNGSTAITTSDKLRLCKLPKGAVIIPELCSFFSDDVDPDSAGNLTVAMKVTDGTTTKTIIAATALQAINTRVTAAAAAITALNFFKTSNDDFYVYLEPAAGDLDASAEVFAVIAYHLDESGRYETTT